MGHDLQLFVERKAAVLQAGDQDRSQERHDDGNIVKAHLDMQTVFKYKTEPQIQDQKNTDRQQRDRACGFLFHMFLSLFKKLTLTAGAAGVFVYEL